MVLEFWFEKKCILPNAWEIMLQSALFVTIAVAGVYMLGLQQASVFLFLVGLPSIPFLLKVFECEVEAEELPKKFLGSGTLGRHYHALRVLAAFFLGLVIAFSVWYLILPQGDVNAIFGGQKQELVNIQGAVRDSLQGLAINPQDAFELIFTHNLQVLIFVVVFSLVYGAGAVFILTWNASVIAAFIGEFSKAYVLRGGAATTGVTAGSVTGASIAFLGLLPHGTFELLAYLTAALAGGILSAAIIRGDLNKPAFNQIAYDMAKLIGWSIMFLAIGAFIESSPALLAVKPF